MFFGCDRRGAGSKAFVFLPVSKILVMLYKMQQQTQLRNPIIPGFIGQRQAEVETEITLLVQTTCLCIL